MKRKEAIQTIAFLTFARRIQGFNSPFQPSSRRAFVVDLQQSHFPTRPIFPNVRSMKGNDYDNSYVHIQSLKHVEWTKVVSTAVLSLSLLFSPVTLLPTESVHGWSIQSKLSSARAADEILPSPAQISPLTTGTTYSLRPVVQTETRKTEIRKGVLDEVWRLTEKYYIDRSYNNLDWYSIRDKFESKDDNPPKDGAKSMSLASEMMSLLGDKYSRVLDSSQYSNIQKFDLIGVGATFMPEEGTKRIMVGAPPVAGSAADKAGLKVGDFITAVNGKPTAGRNSFDIIDQIGENPNSKTINFSVAPGGNEDEIREVTLERSFIEIKNPISVYRLEDRKDGSGFKVGYVRIREFNALVKNRLSEALQDLESQGANAYVLDLRSNPGGAFQSAVDLASLFMEDKIATYVVDNNSKELPFKTTKGKMLVDATDPVVIWLDKRTASASEVFAGALHDNCRAIIMGPERSFGKGVIQAVYGLKNGGGLVLTVAKYVTPSGVDIQGTGIAPDVKAKLPTIPGSTSDTSMVDFNSYADVSHKVCAKENI